LQQKVLDGLEEWTPEGGTPQGAVISPLLSNIYLDPLDQLLARQGYELVRYADDFIILSRSQEEAERALAEVRKWTAEAGLALHPEKTRIVDATQKGGFDFLGYHFERDYKWPAQKSLWKFKETIRVITKRTSGQSLPVLITRLNERLRGWFGYFKHSLKFTFKRLDGWIRRRLRSILRRRRGAYGMAKGRDQRLYPNRYFAGLGLYSLEQAQVKASQPLKR
jgi:RNA-directed DNA polymerase